MKIVMKIIAVILVGAPLLAAFALLAELASEFPAARGSLAVAIIAGFMVTTGMTILERE